MRYHDPDVPSLNTRRSFIRIGTTHEPFPSMDAVVVLTDHSSIDYKQLVADSVLVLDTRNATRGLQSY